MGADRTLLKDLFQDLPIDCNSFVLRLYHDFVSFHFDCCCLIYWAQILFDNTQHDGKIPVSLNMNNTWLECKGEIKGLDSVSK